MRIPAGILSRTVGLRYTIDNWFYKAPPSTKQLFSALRNSAKGKPVLVVGNGPSLNQTPLGDFKGVASLAMNKINLLFPRTTWRPTAILCVNNLVVQQNLDYFRSSEIPILLPWKSHWFGGSQTGTRNMHYFKSVPRPEFSTDFASEAAGIGGTVTYTALQLAYFMGADPVILFGVDHSFAFKGTKTDILRSEGADVNHFDPNYFGKGVLWGAPDLDASEQAYERSRIAFQKDGRRVLDATIGGKLQIFPKISLDEAKRLCGVES